MAGGPLVRGPPIAILKMMAQGIGISPVIEGTLQRLYDSSPTLPLSASDRFVILSDLHLGDGSSRDDFLPNGELLGEILRSYYLPGGHALVLNGDIEELQRFSLPRIRGRWEHLYALFRRFGDHSGVHRIVGNHDEALWRSDPRLRDQPLQAALRLSFGADTLFVFHGHQATIFFERFNDLSGFFLRHFANRLHIRNAPAHYESTKRYRTEHRVYAFSNARKIVSVIGHTHRPLFESLSRVDTLRFRIEQLCRDYPGVSPRARLEIEEMVKAYKRDLALLAERGPASGERSSLYDEHLWVPCLFNSGCAIGKRGLTAIEIEDGQIALVHWFDARRDGRPRPRGREPHSGDHGGRERSVAATRRRAFVPPEAESTRRLGETPYYRSVLKRDRLDYVFSRIRLLA
jgi:predicted phosphodiesterase